MAAELGYLELAYDYLGEAALDGPARTWRATPATACTWRRWPARGPALVEGFGGMRASGGRSAVRAPGCRAGSAASRSGSATGGRRIAVTVDHERATYDLRDGDPITDRAPPRRAHSSWVTSGRAVTADPEPAPGLPQPARRGAGGRRENDEGLPGDGLARRGRHWTRSGAGAASARSTTSGSSTATRRLEVAPVRGRKKASTTERWRERSASGSRTSAPQTRRRARLASCRAAAGERPTIGAISSKGRSNMSCSTNAEPLGRGHGVEHDEEGETDRVGQQRLLARAGTRPRG